MKNIVAILLCTYALMGNGQTRFHKVLTNGWGGTNGEIGYAIIDSPSNNTYIGGGSVSIAPFNDEMGYFSTDINGDFLWGDIFYSYGTFKSNSLQEIRKTLDSNFISTAQLESSPNHLPQTSHCAFHLRKFDDEGNTIWEKMYGIPGTHKIESTVQLTDSSYASVGYFYDNVSGTSSTWFLKMNSFGDTLWSKLIPNTDGKLVFENGSNEFTVISAKQYTGIPPGETQTYGWKSPNIFKLNALGQVTDTSYIDTSKVITLNKGVKISNNMYCVGVEQELLTSASSGFVVALNSNNDTLWTRNFGASTGDSYFFNDVVYDSTEDALYVAGYINEEGVNRSHIIKLDTDGNVLWNIEYPAVDAYVYGMALGLDEGVIITGLGVNGQGNLGTLLLKVDSNGAYSLANIEEEKELDKQNLIIYPNPTSEKVNIDLSSIDFNSLNLILYNFDGKKIRERDYQYEETIQLDLSSFANGLYHLVLTFDNQDSVSKKIVKQ